MQDGRHLAIVTLLSRHTTSPLCFGDLKGNMSLSYLLSLQSYGGVTEICPVTPLPPPPAHDSVKGGWQSKEIKFLNNAIFTSQVVVGAVFCISHEIWKPGL